MHLLFRPHVVLRTFKQFRSNWSTLGKSSDDLLIPEYRQALQTKTTYASAATQNRLCGKPSEIEISFEDSKVCYSNKRIHVLTPYTFKKANLNVRRPTPMWTQRAWIQHWASRSSAQVRIFWTEHKPLTDHQVHLNCPPLSRRSDMKQCWILLDGGQGATQFTSKKLPIGNPLRRSNSRIGWAEGLWRR